MTSKETTKETLPAAMTPPANAPDREDTKYEVTPLELFFDLVFVFAVSQLSRHLAQNLSWRGAAETLVLLLAVFAAWYYTSWETTVVGADKPRTVPMVLTVMLVGLFMNASLPRAFSASGWMFVVSFLVIQLGRTCWTLANAPNALFREHYVRTVLWLVATSPLWIVGAIVNPEIRLFWWALAAVIDLTGTWLAHPIPGRRLLSADVDFEGGHMLERCRQFVIIALGETVVTTATAIAAAPMIPITVLTGTAALLGTVALWALSFGGVDRLIAQHVEEETRDPILATRLVGNALTAIFAGLIAVAVANELVIAHPYGSAGHGGHTPAALSLLLFGGPALFLLSVAWYLKSTLRVAPRLQLVGCAALALVGIVSLFVLPWIALAMVAVVLISLALLERKKARSR